MKKTSLSPHVGSFIKRAIADRGLSVYETAKRANIAQSTLNQIVNKKRSVSMEVAFRLAKLFGVRPDIILDIQTNCEVRKKKAEIESLPSYRSIQTLEPVEELIEA